MLKSLNSQHNEVFLSLLRDRREAVGIAQVELAQKLGQTQAMVSRVENGERRLDVIELRAWLRVLGVDFLVFMRALDTRLRDLPTQAMILRRSAQAGDATR